MRKSLGRLTFALGVAVAITGPLASVALATPVTPPTPRTGKLVQAGPITENGFPAWYRDSNGIRLEGCYTLEDPLCPALADEVPDPDAPISFPENFPGEHFYQLAGAELTLTNGVDATIGMDLEAAFAAEEAIEGDQMVFGRVRIRFDAVGGERYRITHPYGIDDIVADARRGVNMTEDIGAVPGDFAAAMSSRIGPFLRWDPAVAPTAPAGYVGDPGVDHRVVGSPYGTNFVRIEQLDPVTGAVLSEVGFTNLFSIQGRLARNSGVDLDQASYAMAPDGTGTLDVFASSEPGQSVEIVGDPALGYRSTRLRGNGSGRYYGRFPITGAVSPTTKVELINSSDNPVPHKTRNISDVVWVDEVRYNADAGTLLVRASSSDRRNNPALTVTGFGPVSATAFTGVLAPPPTITVTSAMGGTTTVPLIGSGGTFQPAAPVAAATAAATPIVGQTVQLDGTGSTGVIDSFAWTQTAGPAVTLTGATTANATFVPATAGTYRFNLVVSGPGGTSAPSTVTVTVVAPAGSQANAGPDQTVVRGRTVNLDGSQSTRVETYSWRQVSGPAVTLVNPTSARPSFLYPNHALPATPGPNPAFVYDNAPIVLELTARNPAGTATDQVVINPQAETLGGLAVRYRTNSGEWRISGTSSLIAGQRVEAVLGTGLTGRVIGTPATVDAAGAFSIRLNAAAPGAGNTTISLISSTGGRALGTPINVTN
jgi:hypothetical protein